MKRILIIILLIIAFPRDSFSANEITVSYDVFDGKYILKFNPSIITKKQLDRYVEIHPHHYNSYYLIAPQLELCIEQDSRYYECGSRDLKSPNFFKNAEVNINIGKKHLEELNKLKYPKELEPLVNYFKKSLSFSLWANQRLYKFYQSWDIGVLKKEYNDIDPSIVCAEPLRKIQDAKSEYEKYRIAQHEWFNKLNDVFRNKIGKEPIQSWENFILKYKIKEEFILDVD